MTTSPTPAPALTHAQQDAQMLSSLASRGKIGGQVPHMTLFLTPETTPGEYDGLQAENAATIARLIQDGRVAWKVGVVTPGRPKVLYTNEPKNPLTGREIQAYLWMTPLAVMHHGAELYAAYAGHIQEAQRKYPQTPPPLGRAEFDAQLLLDTVPVDPKFASLVPAHIAAATIPAPKVKTKPIAKPSKTPLGHVATLGARNSEAVVFNDEKGQALLDKLEQWNVGPGTQMGGRYGEGDPNISTTYYIERAAITSAGVTGAQWLAKRGFTPDASWLVHAMDMDDPDGLATMRAIQALGADPKGLTGGVMQNTLWHELTLNAGDRVTQARIDWLKAEGVDWNAANIAGELPLASLLSQINSKMTTDDFFSANGPMGNFGAMLSSMAGSMPGMGGLAGQLAKDGAKNKKEIDVLTDLAIEMVQGGVDPFQKALDGTYPWQRIGPDQIRAEKLIHSRLPKSEPNPERAVMQELFFGDRESLKKDRAAYGTKMLSFIERMEAACGTPLLTPAGNAPPPRKPKP